MERQLTTKNQIDMFYYPNRQTHSFCLSLYVRAGVLYEEEEENGITHFLEHVLFRNVNHLMDGQMYREIDKLGLYFNGATYKEFMQLYIIGAPERFLQAAELLLRVFEPISLPVSELDTERQRVKSEIREAEEFKSLDYFASTFVWEETPLSRSILGTRSMLSGFSRKRLADYQRKVFSPENVFFYVTGNVSPDDLERWARRAEKIPPATESLAKRRNCAPIPRNFGQRAGRVNVKNSRYTMIQFSYDFVTAKYSSAELALLYDILFSGENSLMHQELSEKRGLIYSFSPALEKYNNIGRIYFTYEVAARDFLPALKVTAESLASIGENMPERLAMVLPEYTDNAYMIYDDNETFNWQRAYEGHILQDRSRSIEESRETFRAVTSERLCHMAEEIFVPDNLVLSVKGDRKKIDPEEVRRTCGA